MSNASFVHAKYDPSNSELKASAKAIVAKAKANKAKFVTYVPVDGSGEGVTVVLHQSGSAHEHGAALAEFATKTHKGVGAKALAGGPKRGVKELRSRTATITSFGAATGPKPYAIAFAVSYKPEKAAELRRAGHAIAAHNPAFRYHVIRRDGLKGHAIVVVPVDDLNALDKPVSEKAQPLVKPFRDALTSVTAIKLRRVAALSS